MNTLAVLAMLKHKGFKHRFFKVLAHSMALVCFLAKKIRRPTYFLKQVVFLDLRSFYFSVK